MKKTEIEIDEKPLFTIKTVKKKHLDQLRETSLTTKDDFEEYEVLGKIDCWYAVLVRHSRTGQYRVLPLHRYADWLCRTDASLKDAEAYVRANELPQLFLD